jgi:hypothetical protein
MHGRLICLVFATTVLSGAPALAQDHTGHPMPPPAASTPPPPPSPPPPPAQQAPTATPAPADQPAGHGQAAEQTPSAEHDMSSMTGVFGFYPMTRDASGTSWQPDASAHMGQMSMRGDWMLMGHALLNGVYDWQNGPRGDEKAFIAGMVMGMARRDLANGDIVQFRAMLSPDPFMGKDGYPLLLAAGETADGVTHLVDRQHPHDLFMELSASYTHNLSDRDAIFVYGGLPGEPAFGPPAFMHRQSTLDSPEAPITHHWFDSTHITFGVLTAGWVHGNWKIEASRFRGREPDEERYDIETGELDSTAVRVSWNPTDRLALQMSWADITSPEALEPDVDDERWSASAIYTMPIGEEGWWSTALIVGQKEPSDDEARNAWAVESAYHPNPDWTFFARAEQIETDELLDPGPIERVSKLSVGAIRDFALTERVTFGVGALYTQNWVPDALEPSYDGDQDGAIAFVRLRIS